MNLSRCHDVIEQLPAFVEGELGNIEAARVRGHVEICRGCRAEELQLRSCLGTLRSVAPISAPSALQAKFAAKVAKYERAPARSFGAMRWAASAACLLLVIGVGATVRNSGWFHPQAPPIVTNVQTDNPSVRVADSNPNTHNSTINNENPGSLPTVDKQPLETNRVAIIEPENPEPIVRDDTPRTRVIRHRPTVSNNASVASSNSEFLSIRAVDGTSAADIIAMKRRTGQERIAAANYDQSAAKAEMPRPANIPAAPGVKMIVPERDEQLHVGSSVTNVHTETGFDSRGEIALIRIKTDGNVKLDEK
ncbi:MAG: zf-HC2 domain-containing protein [Chthonomonadales bacterium]